MTRAILVFLAAISPLAAQDVAQTGDPVRGKTLFETNCALCHSDSLGPNNAEIIKQAPSLVGVLGRHSGASANFSYTDAMRHAGLVWDAPTLNRFLTKPQALVPNTTMAVAIPDPKDRIDLIAYLSSLKAPAHSSAPAAVTPAATASPTNDPGDWQNAAPGVKHHLTLADLSAPFATRSAGNPPQMAAQPAGATLAVPSGFVVRPFATGFSNPRIIRIAPNGDIFVAETAANRIRILRAADGADAPSVNQIFVDGLDRPFGIAFYPLGPEPKWIYVANNNSVVRFPYHSGDLQVTGPAEIIVPKLTDSHGGHSTRDVAFSLDGKRLFISVGSSSNVDTVMAKKTVEEAQAWEAMHGFGAAWDADLNRADVLVTDPEGKQPFHTFATGIRNGVGIAVDPATGVLWTASNERDGLGDDLVPDYVTSVKEGGFYGWPWYYLGNHEDPRHAGERPDLAGKAIVPDVLLQSHSAPLELTFYTAKDGVAAFPAEYRGDIFVADHGSWNRTVRTGYKIIRVRMNHGVATGEYDDFLTGFVVDNRSVWGRPVGVAVAHDGALLFSDDGRGIIWRVAYTGGR